MKRTHKRLSVFAAVIVACAVIATCAGTNSSNAYITDLRQSLRLRLQPDNVDAYISRGNAKGELERYQEAIADYSQALQLQPDNAYAYDHRGFAYFVLGQYRDAIADYDQALQLRPDFAAAY